MNDNKGKIYHGIYPTEPWSVTETAFIRENNYRNETTFALSNGYIGTRGTLEEGYDFSIEEGLEGNFVNGFYESEDIRYGEWNFGFPERSQSLLNLPNGKRTGIWMDGERFDMEKGRVRKYERTLFMKEGLVRREVEWVSPMGKAWKLVFERLVSMAYQHVMAQRVRILPLEKERKEKGEAAQEMAEFGLRRIEVRSYLDADVENHTRKTNPLVDYGPFGKRLKKERSEGGNTRKTAGGSGRMLCGGGAGISVGRGRRIAF